MAIGNVSKWSAMALSSSSIRVTWDAATDAATYRVFRSFTTDGGYAEVGRVTTSEYIDRGLDAGVTYYYKIRPYDASNTGGEYSGAASATTLATSERGLFEEGIFTDIADAIRAKTETTGKIFPVQMAGIIAALETGGMNAVKGTFTPSSDSYTADLGVALPKSDNYLFIYAINAQSTLSTSNSITYCGVKAKTSAGSGTRVIWTSRITDIDQIAAATMINVSTDNSYITLTTGDSAQLEISATMMFIGSKKYEWWYVYE